jgi:biopolymer transport protein ExbB/TolQ
MFYDIIVLYFLKGYWKLLKKNKKLEEEVKTIKEEKEIKELKEENKKMIDEIKKNEKMKLSHQELKETKFAHGDEKSYNKLIILYFLFQFLV